MRFALHRKPCEPLRFFDPQFVGAAFALLPLAGTWPPLSNPQHLPVSIEGGAKLRASFVSVSRYLLRFLQSDLHQFL